MSKKHIHVTVSLTTIPSRVDKLLPTLTSLFDQTRTPDDIILYIPKYCHRLGQQFDTIPTYLLELEKNTQLKILQTEDYGPATKYIPAWQSIEPSEDHFLIWVDDDILYCENLIEELVTNCPERSAISVTGFKIFPDHHKMELRHLACADIIEGWGGVCCRTSDIPDLNKYILKKPYDAMNYIEKCHWHSDDFIISRALQSNEIKTVVYCTKKLNRFMNRPMEFGLREDALQNSNVTAGHYAAYAALDRVRNFDNLLREIKGTSL